MLQVFYLDVAKVDLVLHMFLAVLQVFKTYVATVLAIFKRMLQVFYMDVAKVDRVLHMFLRCFASVSEVCCKYFRCMLQVF
jgi:hypothetical protein